MDQSRAIGAGANSTATKIFALLLVVCLVECVTGSCLSYGHSCWGAHGKRSSRAPASAPDWYLTRILRRMAANNEMNQGKRLTEDSNDLNPIFQVDMVANAPATDKLNSNEQGPVELPFSRDPDAKPMLNDDMLSKMKIWQIIRESSDDK